MSKAQPQDQQMVVYQSRRGDKVELSIDIVKNFLVTGKKDLVTTQEFVYFMGVCRARGLNPFAKDCYLIKYSEKDAAAIITAIDFYRSRAKAQLDCVGWDKGVICQNNETGELRYSHGLVLKNETLVGGWFEALPTGWTTPLKLEVNLDGYIKTTSEGKVTAFWAPAKQPSQIMKVAESQGLRTCWPDEFAGTVTAEEMGLQIENFESMDLKGLPLTGEAPPTEPETIDTSAFDKLVDEKLKAVTTMAEEYNLRLRHVEEFVKEIAASQKKANVTPAMVKENAAKKFLPYVDTEKKHQIGFWKTFEAWEAKKYPAPSAPSTTAAATPPKEAGAGQQIPPTRNECFMHGQFEGDDCPVCAQERGEPAPGSSGEAPPPNQPASGAAGADPTFEGRRLALWDSIIDKKALDEVATKFGIQKTTDITPENFDNIKWLVDNYKPGKKSGRGGKK